MVLTYHLFSRKGDFTQKGATSLQSRRSVAIRGGASRNQYGCSARSFGETMVGQKARANALPSSTPGSRHQHVRRQAAGAPRQLQWDGLGSEAAATFSLPAVQFDAGAVPRGNVGTASTAPRLGTTIALGSGGISEVAGQYPHLEHTTRDGLSSLEWLAPVQEPVEPSQSTGMHFILAYSHTGYTCTQSRPHHWRLHMHQYSGHGWFSVSSLA